MRAGRLAELFLGSEGWLADRVVRFGAAHGPRDAVVREGVGVTVAALCSALVQAAQASETPPAPEVSPGAVQSPWDALAAEHAHRVLQPSAAPQAALSTLKCYREAFLEVAREHGLACEEAQAYAAFVLRFFDALELAVASRWRPPP